MTTPIDLKKTVGQRLQLLRIEKNLTQEEMGEKLSLSTSAYCKIEYGKTDLTLTRLSEIVEVLNMSDIDLFSKIEGNVSINHPKDCGCVWIAKDSSTVRIEQNEDLKELVKANSRLIDMICKRMDEIENKTRSL